MVQKLKDYVKKQNLNLIYSIIVSVLIVIFVEVINSNKFQNPFWEITDGISFFSGISLLIFVLTPIMFGLITTDKEGSVVVGVVPITSILLYTNFISGSHMGMILKGIAYTGSLAVIGGVEGYLASTKRIEYIFIAVCLGILWILVFLTCGF